MEDGQDDDAGDYDIVVDNDYETYIYALSSISELRVRRVELRGRVGFGRIGSGRVVVFYKDRGASGLLFLQI